VSKKDKILKKLYASPTPKDFRWEDLVTLMRRAGFTESCDGGSHYTFEHVSGYRVQISKTHPGGILKPYQVKSAKEALQIVGIPGDSSGAGS
jgi:predicted RNA binding protein YcfA (HicA-like mRNA interferase family)